MVFKCKNCGGGVVYNPEKKKMVCLQCDSLESQKAETQTQQNACLNCGAPLEPEAYQSAGRCAHCGTYFVSDDKVTGIYQPNLVLPFTVGKEQALEILKREFLKGIFLPKDFLSEKTVESLFGIYVPFWLYDYSSDVNFEGIGVKVRSWRSGDTQYTETSQYKVLREVEVDFEKIPVDASIKMNDSIMDLMEPYEYPALERFQEKYMSGFYAEYYNEDGACLEGRAKVRAKEYTEGWLQDSIKGYDSVRPIKKEIRIDRTDLKYALMPVWVYRFRYQNKDYEYFVNGQTGKVVGKRPFSLKKALCSTAAVYALTYGICSAFFRLLEVL